MSTRDVNFLVVGDLHVGKDVAEEQDLFTQLNDHIARSDPRPEFVVFLGDLTNLGQPAQYTCLKELLASCPVPAYLVRGNHDKGGYAAMLADAPVASPIQADVEQRIGLVYRWNSFYWEPQSHNAGTPLYPRPAHYGFYDDAQPPLCAVWDAYPADYTFDVAGRRFIVMDTCRWIFSDDQMRWLADQLATDMPTVLMMHHHLLPVRYIFDAATVWNAPEVLRMVRDRPNVLAVLHGHVHFNRQWTYGGHPVVTTAYRQWRHMCIRADNRVEVGPAQTDEPAIEPYRPWNLVYSAFDGTIFRVQDSRLWHFGQTARDAGLAWGGRADAAQGVAWTTFVDAPQCRRPARVRLCLVARGPWQARVTDADGTVLASQNGTGNERRQEVDLAIAFPIPADYTVSLDQPGATDHHWVRCAQFVLVDFGDEHPDPPLWNWGQA